jgi:hypothetical protein
VSQNWTVIEGDCVEQMAKMQVRRFMASVYSRSSELRELFALRPQMAVASAGSDISEPWPLVLHRRR